MVCQEQSPFSLKMVSASTLRIGGLMGFELLPIEVGDEDRYDVITIISPSKWTPQKFVGESPQELMFYDPSDEIPVEAEGYPASVNHTSQIDTSAEDEDETGVVGPYQPLCETQVFATTKWHRAIHHEIDPECLRPYLGWRPVKVVKKTLQWTTQLARMITRYPLRRHIKSRFPHLYGTKIDEAVSTDPLFSNCRSIYHGYTAAQIFFDTKSYVIFIGSSQQGSSQEYTGASLESMEHYQP